MTDSDSVNPFEAPSQLTVSSDPTIVEPIQYVATPTVKDLNSALRSRSAIFFASILLSMLTLALVGVSIGLVDNGLKSSGKIALLIMCLYLIPLVAFHLYSTIFVAKRHLHFSQNATDQKTAELTSRGLLFKSEKGISWCPHNGLRSCVSINNQVLLSYGQPGAEVRLILPKRGFRDPTQAIRFLEFQANQPREVSIILEPVIGPIMIGDQPAEAVAFGGILQQDDLAKSPLKATIKRNTRRNVIGLLIAAAVLLPAAIFMFDLIELLLLTGAFCVLFYLTIQNIRTTSKFFETDAPVLAFQGWLNEREVALLDNFGQSRCGWEGFRTVGLNDACIWLQVYAPENSYVVLPRRFFADDTQWRTATRIAASYSTK